MFTELSQSLANPWQRQSTNSLREEIAAYNTWTTVSNALLGTSIAVLACAILGITSTTFGLGVALISMTVRSFIVAELAKLDLFVDMAAKMFNRQIGGGSSSMGFIRQPLNREKILQPLDLLESIIPEGFRNFFGQQ